MWVFLVIGELIIPAVVLLNSWILGKHPPKRPQNVQRRVTMKGGYGSRRAIQNNDTWYFAQSVSSKWFFKLSLVQLIITVALLLIQYFLFEALAVYIGLAWIVIEAASLLATSIPIERALKQTFTLYGERLDKTPAGETPTTPAAEPTKSANPEPAAKKTASGTEKTAQKSTSTAKSAGQKTASKAKSSAKKTASGTKSAPKKTQPEEKPGKYPEEEETVDDE